MDREALNIVYPFYNNYAALQQQIRNWKRYPSELADKVRIIIVDDHSTEPLCIDEPLPMKVTILRIDQDIPWNQPGAKNLGFKFVTTNWALTTDIDHVVTSETCQQVLSEHRDLSTVYYFSRQIVIDNVTTEFRPHPNSFLICRNYFWEVGGYDEDFCGNYGNDDTLFNKLLKKKLKTVRWDHIKLVAFPTDDNTHLIRSTKTNQKLLRQKLKNIDRGRYHNGNILRFPWHIVKLY